MYLLLYFSVSHRHYSRGAISCVSDAYGGSISDKVITIDSRILAKCTANWRFNYSWQGFQHPCRVWTAWSQSQCATLSWQGFPAVCWRDDWNPPHCSIVNSCRKGYRACKALPHSRLLKQSLVQNGHLTCFCLCTVVKLPSPPFLSCRSSIVMYLGIPFSTPHNIINTLSQISWLFFVSHMSTKYWSIQYYY